MSSKTLVWALVLLFMLMLLGSDVCCSLRTCTGKPGCSLETVLPASLVWLGTFKQNRNKAKNRRRE